MTVSSACRSIGILILFTFWGSPALCQNPRSIFSSEAIQFFEMKIRPLLQNNCVGCHNNQKPTSGLSLESREALLAGGNHGTIVQPGNPEQSLLIHAVEYEGSLKMPPTGKLKPDQIDELKAWVKLDLPWQDEKPSTSSHRLNSDHWAFRAPVRLEPPKVKNLSWCRNSIDKFVLARLERERLYPSPAAEKSTLMRRLSLDLVGLPPGPLEVEQFVDDTRPDAYERLVDRLLASPHYGERWGKHWLDAARYADTGGYSSDVPRFMWRYRDWVIRALNQDMPFDQFTIEQLAGDLLPNATSDQKIATGFHRNSMANLEGGALPEQSRIESVFDRVATTGTVFLGLTIGCAQCHDHKYDPISQKEYYQLFAFFNNSARAAVIAQPEEPIIKTVSPAEVQRYRRVQVDFDLQKSELQLKIAKRNAELLPLIASWEKGLTEKDRQALPDFIQVVLQLPLGQRGLADAQELERFFREKDAESQQLQQALELLESPVNRDHPDHFTAMVLEENDPPLQSHVLIRGDYLRPGVKVAAETPAVLPPLARVESGMPNRLHLARWLVSEQNPLTARVAVNRIWQHYFGRGLVKTSEDFGTQGEKPSHPELLDWLATEFIRQRWSLKAMHRLIVTSATYRQSSRVSAGLRALDPENILLARSPRYRLDAEIIRDIALAVSGLLNPEIGGPSVFPPQPPGVSESSHRRLIWPVATGRDRYRRGIYTFWKRAAAYPGLLVYDAPTADMTTVRRNRSSSPMQSLTTLNDEVYVEAAQHLALRILNEAPDNNRARLGYAFRLCLAREPDAFEAELLQTTLQTGLNRYQANPNAAKALFPAVGPEGLSPERYAAWYGVARVLLNLDETFARE